MVGLLYSDGDGKRDSAFTIFYMGINLGALISPIIVGGLCDTVTLQILCMVF
jgi:POT family proton-dependent oligopeptide transporter